MGIRGGPPGPIPKPPKRLGSDNMDWIRFDKQLPEEGQYIVAIRQLDKYESGDPGEWESDLGWNAVGTYGKGEVWEGGNDLNGFTHWLPLPDRPASPIP